MIKLTDHQKRKKSQGLCVQAYCFNPRVKERSFCHRCQKRRYAEKHPIKYLFNIKKQRAKERGVEWSLTLEEFIEFVNKTNYMELRGKKAGDLSIDRIDPSKGYQADNIQAMTLSDNVAKRWGQDYHVRYSREELERMMIEEAVDQEHNQELNNTPDEYFKEVPGDLPF